MQAAHERRTEDDDRVPLDALIELTHADGGEVLEADAVDVSAGGLSLRASFMPPVGARMQCRFACPPRGDRVVADCEVVWSAWEGPQAGAFGVRFLALDTRSATLIRRLLEPDNEAVRQVLEEVPRPPQPSLVPEPEARAVASLHIEGLGAPIEADVQLDEDDHILLKQELNFLRLGRAVRVDINGVPSRHGRIASVMLEQSPSDVPALSLGVLIDAAELPARNRERAPTSTGKVAAVAGTEHVREVPAQAAPAQAAPAPAAMKEPPALREQPLIAAREWAPEQAPLSATDTWPESPTFTAEPKQPAQDEVVEPAQPSPSASEPAPLASGAAVVSPDATPAHAAPVGPQEAQAETEPAARAGALVQGAWDKLRPGLVQLLARMHSELGRRLPRYRDGLRAAWSVLRDWLGQQLGRFKHVRRTQKKRRTTAPPPRAAVSGQVRRTGRQASEAPASSSGRGRLLLVGLLTFGGVAGAIYALAPRKSPGALELHRAVAPTGAARAASTATAAAQPAQPLAAPPPAVESEAQDEPEAASQASEPDTSEPHPLVFGDADVPNGRTYALRMSGPIEKIEGEERRGGFMVRVPGRLSLDRASPIATSHPALSRSLILNQGDRAELTIEFVRGKKPKYRVEAKGNNLEVTVERI